MKFSKEILTNLNYVDGFEVIYTKMTGQRRWVTEFERVFKHEGKFYRTCYEQGSTECQDDSQPYEYDDDPVECEEVFPVETTVIVYKPKSDAKGAADA